MTSSRLCISPPQPFCLENCCCCSRWIEHLDVLLQQTLEIETALTKCSDAKQLGEYLQQVTSIKVKVLREFTDEELRDDNTFLIFLRQCDGLINGIQLKIIESQRGTA